MTDEMPMNRRDGDIRPVPDPTTLTNVALAREIGHHKDLVEEQFRAVAREMALVESARVEQKQDSLASLAAALSAAKEAVKEQTTASALSIAKSENATNEQLKQLSATFITAIEGVNRTFNDAKERINKLEQGAAAAGGSMSGASTTVAWILAGIGGLVAVASIVIQLSA